MKPSRALEVLVVGFRLVLSNLDLLYWALPRSFRGGYRSPWQTKDQLA